MNIRKVLINILCSFIPGKQRRRRIRNVLLIRISQRLVHIELCDKNFVNKFEVDDQRLLSVLKSLGSFRYIPNPGNLGDCLIGAATFQFFKRHHLLSSITNENNCENIVYGGGGAWVGALYPEACLPALSLFEKAKKIVILPSSVFDCSMLTDVLDSRFIVFCRERKTYQYLKWLNTEAKIYIDSDMALRMDESIFDVTFLSNDFYLKRALAVRDKIKDIGNIACFFREDVEKCNNVQTDYDLSAAFSPNMNVDECKFATALMLSVVDQFDVIATDRLHVGIAAILMGKEVYLFDNSYGKISSVYEHSFSKMSNVHLRRDADLLKIKQLKRNEKESTNNLLRLINALAGADVNL